MVGRQSWNLRMTDGDGWEAELTEDYVMKA